MWLVSQHYVFAYGCIGGGGTPGPDQLAINCSHLHNAIPTNKQVLELDQLPEGSALQAAVAEVCGRNTVPQVFIGGKHVGG